MSDYVDVNTNFGHTNGSPFTGTLCVTLASQITLAGGEIIGPDRFLFPVSEGIANAPDNDGGMALPITEDASPPRVPLYLALLDQQGRKRNLPPIPYVPREAGPLNLNDIIGTETP